jgi:hypothetical protein
MVDIIRHAAPASQGRHELMADAQRLLRAIVVEARSKPNHNPCVVGEILGFLAHYLGATDDDYASIRSRAKFYDAACLGCGALSPPGRATIRSPITPSNPGRN